MGYDDLSPLFRLCWSVSNDWELIRSKAIPPQRSVLGKYLAFLTREDHLEAAERSPGASLRRPARAIRRSC